MTTTMPHRLWRRATKIAAALTLCVLLPALHAAAQTGAAILGTITDPQGLALSDDGYLYVAESSLHRIIRLRVAN